MREKNEEKKQWKVRKRKRKREAEREREYQHPQVGTLQLIRKSKKMLEKERKIKERNKKGGPSRQWH